MKSLFLFLILFFSESIFALNKIENVPVSIYSVFRPTGDEETVNYYVYQYKGEYGGRYFLNSKPNLKLYYCVLNNDNKCKGHGATPKEAILSQLEGLSDEDYPCFFDKADFVITCQKPGNNDNSEKPNPPQPSDNKPANPVTNPTPCGYRVNGQWIPLPCTNPDKPNNTPTDGGGNGGNGTGNSGGTGGGSSGNGGSTPGAGAGGNGTGNGTGDGTDNGGTTYIPPSNQPKPTKPPTKKSHVRIYVSQWGGPGEGSYKQYYLLPRSCLDTTQFAQKSNCDWGYKVKICGAYMSLPKDKNGYCHKWTTVSPAYGEDFVDGDTSIDTDDSGNVTINNITINNNYGNAASSQPATPNDDDLPKLDKGKVTPGRGTLSSNNNGHIGGSGNGSTAGNDGATGNDGGNAAGNGSAGGSGAGSAPNGATGNTSGTPDGNCTPGTVGCTTMGGMGDVDAAVNGNGDIGGGIGDGIGRHDVDISQVGKAGYFVEQGTCPAPKRFTAMRAVHEFSYQSVCDAAAKLRPIVILSALLIAFGVVRAAIIRNT